jgi:lysophospholipase L1-like esterase
MATGYVALGDSLTAGKGDPGPDGRPIGWARRLSRILAERGGAAYDFTNLAVDRATVTDVLADQLPAVPAEPPDLITVSVGMNDIRGAFGAERFGRQLDELFAAVTGTGATVATMTLPNIVSMLPLPAELLDVARELMEQVNDAIRQAAGVHSVLFVDAWFADEVAEPAFWSDDRVHPNAMGHELIAGAFADLLLAPAHHLAPDAH